MNFENWVTVTTQLRIAYPCDCSITLVSGASAFINYCKLHQGMIDDFHARNEPVGVHQDRPSTLSHKDELIPKEVPPISTEYGMRSYTEKSLPPEVEPRGHTDKTMNVISEKAKARWQEARALGFNTMHELKLYKQSLKKDVIPLVPKFNHKSLNNVLAEAEGRKKPRFKRGDLNNLAREYLKLKVNEPKLSMSSFIIRKHHSLRILKPLRMACYRVTDEQNNKDMVKEAKKHGTPPMKATSLDKMNIIPIPTPEELRDAGYIGEPHGS